MGDDLYYCRDIKGYSMNDLYKQYKDWIMFDTDKEIPLIFHKKGILAASCFLITNKYFYYNLPRTKKIRDVNKNIKGKIFLGDIKNFDTKFHTLKDLVSIFVNGNLIGVFTADQERHSADVLKEYLSSLALRGDSLITSVEKVSAATQTREADPATKLKQLKDLLDQGVLNEEEFNTKKQQLLKKM